MRKLIAGKRMTRARRGNALVLSTLILLALTSVGLLSIQQTSADLLVAGNLGRSMQGKLIAEAGLTHATVVAGPGIDMHISQIRSARNAGGFGVVQGGQLAGYSTADPDPTSSLADLTEHLAVIDPANAYSALARRHQQMAYQVNSRWSYQRQGREGYGHNADICHQAFDLNAMAGIPRGGLEDLATTLNLANTDSVIVQYRARALTGPTKCTF